MLKSIAFFPCANHYIVVRSVENCRMVRNRRVDNFGEVHSIGLKKKIYILPIFMGLADVVDFFAIEVNVL